VSGEQTTPRITDEAVDRLRARIGIPAKWRERPRNTVASDDSIRQFAVGYGDDNPLFTDASYAARTRWGSMLAPPLYYMSSGVSVPVEWTDAQAAVMSGGDPLRGIGQYLSSEAWMFVRPVVPGVALRRYRFLHDVELRESTFGGGRAVVLTQRMVYTDQVGRLHAVNDRTYHHAERDTSGQTGKYRDVAIEPYSDDELDRIFEAYEREVRRGATPLTIADVQPHDQLPGIVKGPLTVTDVICYHVGLGWGSTAGPLRLAYQSSRKIPGFFTRNSLNVPDVAQRCHWEHEFAQQLGHPAAYDYGAMRTNWMAHLVTNWMGDDAWIARLSARARRFNYIGDTQWLGGRIERVDPDTDPPSVDVAVWGENQRGETTCTATATVFVADRSGAPPELPELDLDDVPATI
jgi:acyl dehydratase